MNDSITIFAASTRPIEYHKAQELGIRRIIYAQATIRDQELKEYWNNALSRGGLHGGPRGGTGVELCVVQQGGRAQLWAGFFGAPPGQGVLHVLVFRDLADPILMQVPDAAPVELDEHDHVLVPADVASSEALRALAGFLRGLPRDTSSVLSHTFRRPNLDVAMQGIRADVRAAKRHEKLVLGGLLTGIVVTILSAVLGVVVRPNAKVESEANLAAKGPPSQASALIVIPSATASAAPAPATTPDGAEYERTIHVLVTRMNEKGRKPLADEYFSAGDGAPPSPGEERIWGLIKLAVENKMAAPAACFDKKKRLVAFELLKTLNNQPEIMVALAYEACRSGGTWPTVALLAGDKKKNEPPPAPFSLGTQNCSAVKKDEQTAILGLHEIMGIVLKPVLPPNNQCVAQP